VRVLSGKEKKIILLAVTFRVIECIDSLEATAGTFGRSTFHLQRIEEEDEEVNIKFL
jgi:hypothetical protein